MGEIVDQKKAIELLYFNKEFQSCDDVGKAGIIAARLGEIEDEITNLIEEKNRLIKWQSL